MLINRRGNKLILGGDLNVTLDNKIDRIPENDKIYKSVSKLLHICDDIKLIDSWRIKNPDIKRFTWRRTNPLLYSQDLIIGLFRHA